jgi:hypothetical protein
LRIVYVGEKFIEVLSRKAGNKYISLPIGWRCGQMRNAPSPLDKEYL